MYFTRTVLRRPDLGLRVRRLVISAGEGNYDTLEEWPDVTAFDTLKAVVKGIQGLTVEYKARWLAGVMAMRANPLLVLLAQHTPNLEHLEIMVGGEGLSGLTPLLVPAPRALAGSPYLSNLKALYIKDLRQGKAATIKPLEQFLYLPKLEKLSVSYFDGDSAGCPLFDLPVGSSNVKEISFLQSCVDANRLKNLVSACNGLKRFVYEAYSSNDHPNSCQFTALELVPILESQKNSLEMIRVYLGTSYPIFSASEGCSKFGSFTSFIYLKHLEAEQGHLPTIDMLPNSLEHIAITLCEYPIFNILRDLIDGRKCNLQSLEMVILHPEYSSPNGMLGLSRAWDIENIHDTFQHQVELIEACDKIQKIVRGALFEFQIHTNAWANYLMGGT
ncbi:hypothetical protein BBP40_000310 [Aspergillus hancockii]|nr:hypothetical protein BBP40_000310 [Aspergillus hancockii]